ncbi:MAG: DUF1329 domain-containing protein [Endozoicomonas sp.]
MTIRKSLLAAAVTGLSLMASAVSAKVSVEEAKKLENVLTPMGAERAGNAEGTIPAWNPDFKPPAGYVKGGEYIDPYADEKPLFTITAANVEKYKDRLSPGQLGLFKAYPETFKMPVYPTHRDSRYSDYTEQSTRANATRTVMSEDQNSVIGAKGGAPFPIPKNGAEVMWNTSLARGAFSQDDEATEYIVYRDGSVLKGGNTRKRYSPYYDPKVSLEEFESKKMPMLYTLIQTTAPSRDKGNKYLVHEFTERSGAARKAWSYTPGVRRVRRAPTVSFDTPQGIGLWRTTDETYGFNGSFEKYNWTLEGKKEMYIPYNNYKFSNTDAEVSELLLVGHANPEYQRYELHRVWVVKADLKDDQRNVYKTRVLFIDEDSWLPVAVDQYDNRDTLWRTSLGLTNNYHDIGGVQRGPFLYHDLFSREYFAGGVTNYVKQPVYNSEPESLSYFKPANLRKLGVR